MNRCLKISTPRARPGAPIKWKIVYGINGWELIGQRERERERERYQSRLNPGLIGNLRLGTIG